MKVRQWLIEKLFSMNPRLGFALTWIILTGIVFGLSWLNWSVWEGPHIRALVQNGIPMRPEDWPLWWMWGISPIIALIWSMVGALLIMAVLAGPLIVRAFSKE